MQAFESYLDNQQFAWLEGWNILEFDGISWNAGVPSQKPAKQANEFPLV
jgi:hypothetical protein